MKWGGKTLVMLFLTLCALGGSLATTSCARSPLPPAAQPSLPAAQPPAVLSSKQSGNLSVALLSAPNPPVRGNNILIALVTDLQGRPISDAKLTFDLDMTNMSHGKNVVTASPQGGGQYSGQVTFLMPGPWRAIVRIELPGQTESIRFDFNVNFR